MNFVRTRLTGPGSATAAVDAIESQDRNLGLRRAIAMDAVLEARAHNADRVGRPTNNMEGDAVWAIFDILEQVALYVPQSDDLTATRHEEEATV